MADNPEGTSGGNFWTRKIGPLPAWAWAALVLVAIVVYLYYRRSQASSSTASTDTTATADESSQVPEFINQTYVSTTPPATSGTGTTPTGPPVNGGNPPHVPPTTPPPVKTPPKKPVGTLAAPTGIHATNVTSSSIALTWGKVTGATGYRVRVTYQSKLVTSQNVSGTSATISGLGADHTYTVHVASVNGAGTGAESNGPAIKTTR